MEIKQELWSDFMNMTSSQWINVDTLRKHRKLKNVESHCKQLIENLSWHFKVQGNTTDNNFYKIDAFVWQFIFKERIDRYDDRVYKLSYYLVNNYQYLQSISFADLTNFKFNWDIDSIPRNYKDIILKYNPVLSQEEYFKEQSSNYSVKKYHYFFLNEKDREEDNMSKTYLRFNLQEKLNNLRSNIPTTLSKDVKYDEIKDKQLKTELVDDYQAMKNSKTNFTMLFWKTGIMKNLFNKLDKENAEREKIKDGNDIIQYLPGKHVLRFSAKNLKDNVGLFEKIQKYRKNLVYNKKLAFKPYYHIYEERVLISPELNISTRLKKRKPLADRIFNL